MPFKTLLKSLRVRVLFSFLIVIVFLTSISVFRDSYTSSRKILIYGFIHKSPSTDFYYEYFTQRFGIESVTLRDLDDPKNREEFLNICIRMMNSGIQLLPSGHNFCIACELSDSSFEELVVKFTYPIVLVFVDRQPVAIVISNIEAKKLDEVFTNLNHKELLIITKERSQSSNDQDLKSYLKNIILSLEG